MFTQAQTRCVSVPYLETKALVEGQVASNLSKVIQKANGIQCGLQSHALQQCITCPWKVLG